ncbi:glutathione s-transferase [Moniliophthora roreri MCA 2997]|uniref:glutathione transferase n=2 Tax=Moniliophthora roreri TaxID=221103 RepID=V2X2P6_MONRO|nr:glutathione s-transferase [Moniliophthora roreri MCA 2997]
MIVVYHLDNSRSQRILWLLEELCVPYEIKKYERTPNGLAPPELLKVYPLGKSPVITDGDLTLAESGAIVEYLIKKYGEGKFTPPEKGEIDNLYFTHYAEGSIMPTFVMKLIFTMIPQKSPWILRWLLRIVFDKIESTMLAPELKKHSDLMESHLSKKEWLAGGNGPTSADFLMSMPAEILELTKLAGPSTVAYVRRIHKRPAYRTALQKGGEYAYAKS